MLGMSYMVAAMPLGVGTPWVRLARLGKWYHEMSRLGRGSTDNSVENFEPEHGTSLLNLKEVPWTEQ